MATLTFLGNMATILREMKNKTITSETLGGWIDFLYCEEINLTRFDNHDLTVFCFNNLSILKSGGPNFLHKMKIKTITSETRSCMFVITLNQLLVAAH